MADQYDGWRKLLRGEVDSADLHPNPEDALSGFYRVRSSKTGPYEPLSIFRDADGLHFVLGSGKNAREVNGEREWPFCAHNPISHKVYQAVAEGGKSWPDMDATVERQMTPGIGDNSGAVDEAELIKEQIESAQAGAASYTKIEDDDTLRRAQSLRSRLLELKASAEKKHKVEKEPHLKAGREADAKWLPLAKLADTVAVGIRRAMDAWETEKLRREREAQRAAEEAARKAAEAGKPVPVAPPPAPTPMAAPIKGAYGRSAGVKLVKVVTAVTDWDALYGFMKGRPEVQDLLTKLAQKAVDAGNTVPGVTVEEQRKVA